MKRPKVTASKPALTLELSNRQNSRRINLVLWRRIILRLLTDLSLSGKLGVHLIDAKEMAALNMEFLKHAGSTDVLTFDYHEGAGNHCVLNGEIFISVDDAIASAPRFRATWQQEMVRYLVHGVLHLQGCDDHRAADRREMKKREDRLLMRLSLSFDWGRLGRQ